MKLHAADADVPALGMLLSCHQRIRRFAEMGVRLSEARQASPGAVRESAEALARYFTVAFPLHEEDEDQRLAPALAGLALSDEARRLLERLPGEHRALDALLATLLPAWRALAAGPGDAAGLLEPARAFARQLHAHAEVEERVLFPEAARLLPHHVQVSLAAAMRERRSGTSTAPALLTIHD